MANAGLLLICAGVLGFFSSAFADPYALPKVSFIFGGAFFMWIALCFKPGDDVNEHSLGLPVMAVCGAMIVCTASSIDPLISIFGPRAAQFNSIMAYSAIALVALAVARSNITHKNIVLFIIASSIPGTVYAVCQGLFHDPLLVQALQGGRVIGAQGSPVWLGAVLCTLAPLSVYLIKVGEDRTERAMGALSLALIFFAIILTKTRGAMVGMIVGLYIQAMFLWPSHSMKITVATVVAGVGAVFLRDGTMMADMGRLETWKIAWDAFIERPLLGWGPDTFRIMFRRSITPDFLVIMGDSKIVQAHAHNDILQIASTMGLVGLAAYAVLFMSVVRVISKGLGNSEHLQYAACAFGAAGALWVCAKLNPVPLSSMVIVAVVLAPLYRTGRTSYTFRRPFAAMMACCLFFVVSVRLNGAESETRKAIFALKNKRPLAALTHSDNAANLNPWDPYHLQIHLEMVRYALPIFKTDDAQMLVLESIKTAEAAADAHPNNPDSLESLGVIRGVTAMVGLPSQVAEGLADLDRAQELAPTFRPIADRRMRFAKFLGRREDSL